MYSITVEGDFSAAHNVRYYKGECERLHGHNWRVVAAVVSGRLQKTGMVMDFKELKSRLNEILERLDHKYLNNLGYFKKINPTSENIARYIYDNLKPRVSSLKSVTVWENPTDSAAYE